MSAASAGGTPVSGTSPAANGRFVRTASIVADDPRIGDTASRLNTNIQGTHRMSRHWRIQQAFRTRPYGEPGCDRRRSRPTTIATEFQTAP
jgi:hypothetical protein